MKFYRLVMLFVMFYCLIFAAIATAEEKKEKGPQAGGYDCIGYKIRERTG